MANGGMKVESKLKVESMGKGPLLEQTEDL